jgi:hypothetical protein
MERQPRFLARKSRDELTAMAFLNAERETGIRSGPGAHRASEVGLNGTGAAGMQQGKGVEWIYAVFVPSS